MQEKEDLVGQEGARPESDQEAADAQAEAAAAPEADEASGDAETEEPVAARESEARPAQGPAADGEEAKEADEANDLESLKPGTQIRGTVRRVLDFGAFVDVGVGRDGLAHISTLKRAGLDQKLKEGDTIDVVVRRVDVEGNRISLAAVDPEAESKTALRELEVDSVVTGRVVRLVDFGAFVDIGARTDGLLHVSELPHGFVNHPSEVLTVGDEIDVRIKEVDNRRRRISLTMRGTGQNGGYSAPPPDNTAPKQDDAGPQLPTAFEVAFQEARAKLRQRRRNSD